MCRCFLERPESCRSLDELQSRKLNTDGLVDSSFSSTFLGCGSSRSCELIRNPLVCTALSLPVHKSVPFILRPSRLRDWLTFALRSSIPSCQAPASQLSSMLQAEVELKSFDKLHAWKRRESGGETAKPFLCPETTRRWLLWLVMAG